jgi:hypothetical protein
MIFTVLSFFLTFVSNAQTKTVTEEVFDGCIEISNDSVRVVLDPNLGGRVLKYEINGKNILYIDPDELNRYVNNETIKAPSAGRFDIGPVRIIPKHPSLFKGKWEAEITGAYSACLISAYDTTLGVKLLRAFTLEEKGSKLTCTQTIKNLSDHPKRYCHWGRTFVTGGGISVVPLNSHSRFPRQYIAYGNNNEMYFYPENEAGLVVANDLFVMEKQSAYKKYVMDGDEGWMAYYSNDNTLFIKTFNVYPDKKYGEMTAATASVWFRNTSIVEIEPMGPWEWIKPGDELVFTEIWYLFDLQYNHSKDDLLKLLPSFLDNLQ